MQSSKEGVFAANKCYKGERRSHFSNDAFKAIERSSEQRNCFHNCGVPWDLHKLRSNTVAEKTFVIQIRAAFDTQRVFF